MSLFGKQTICDTHGVWYLTDIFIIIKSLFMNVLDPLINNKLTINFYFSFLSQFWVLRLALYCNRWKRQLVICRSWVRNPLGRLQFFNFLKKSHYLILCIFKISKRWLYYGYDVFFIPITTLRCPIYTILILRIRNASSRLLVCNGIETIHKIFKFCIKVCSPTAHLLLEWPS